MSGAGASTAARRRGGSSSDTLQATLPAGTRRLRPNQRLLIGGPGYVPETNDRAADAATAVSLADATSGVLLTTADGARVDGVTVSNHLDTACQTGDDKLGSVLDYRSRRELAAASDPTTAGSSAPRTAGGRERRGVGAGQPVRRLRRRLRMSPSASSRWTPQSIQRLTASTATTSSSSETTATARPTSAAGRSSPAELTDSAIRRPSSTVAKGTRVAPGGTWLAALRGTSAAADADADLR